MPLLTRTDVTAVQFYNNYVLAGIGSEVNVFDKRSGSFVCKQEVLIGQKIYGFVVSRCRQRVLVFGGKQFCVLNVKLIEYVGNIEVFVRCFEPVMCDDWVHSCLWVGDEAVAVLTAHNVVQKWDISTQTLISQYASKDNSILYSALLLPVQDDVLVIAGTVYSEVIINKCGDQEPLHRLTGHKGVIFSISCEPKKNIIVTTSDDRSVRIWGPKIIPEFTNNIEYWKSIHIVCKHELYGHLARVMRSCITDNYVISVGEDSAICVWDLQGNLVKKNTAHQNGCIWAIDNCDDLLVTGGGDCGVVMHPLAISKDYCNCQVIGVDIGTPKKVVLTARRNVVILNESDNLIHYNLDNNNTTVYELNHDSTYKLMSLSSCKQMIAVADMNGKFDVFAESCKNEAVLINLIDTKLQLGKILSMHWAGNRHLVLCSDNGTINVLAYSGNTELFANFTLPAGKERWLTSAAVDTKSNVFILGDRCGNIHVYIKGKQDPIKTFSKVHGRYGPASITIKEDEVVTTGRDGTVKYFHVKAISNEFKYMNRKDLEFQWVEKFLDKDENVICGFQERVFVVYSMRDSSKILEEPCGGGHRSWDAQRCIVKVKDNFEQVIQLVYVKNSEIHLKQYYLNKLMSINLINGSHSKEINCLKVYKNAFDTKTFYISGGEDTTLRISSINDSLTFNDEIVFKHLSSVRTLKLFPTDSNNLLIISAGGRAQINIKNIKFTKTNKVESQELVDYLVKGTDKERKGSQSWKSCTLDFDPETRIMDIDVLKDDKDLYIFAGCSDAVLRVFSYNDTFKLIKESKYHKTCILKTHCFKLHDKYILATATTRGDIAFWLADKLKTSNFEPFFVVKTRNSGVNSIATKVLDDTSLILATGGDDNCILVQLLKIDQTDLISFTVESAWSSSKYHSSQITGVSLIENLLITTSIDQRVTLFKWIIKDGIHCVYESQKFSNVADIQGIDIIEVLSDSIKVCVFGKGLEVVSVPKSRN